MVKNKKTIQFIGVDCILMVILTLLDQWTKSLVVHHLKDQSDIILIPGVFQLHYLENRGAAFGILQNQRIIFVILTIIYLAAVFWFLHRCPKNGRYTLLHIIASVLTAGALGNFIDRLRLGYVVDFFYFELINFPIFNVADIYVTCGAALFFIVFIFVYKEEDVNEMGRLLFPWKRKDKNGK